MTLLLLVLLCQTSQEHLDLAVKKSNAGDFEGAIVECGKAIEKDALNGMAYYNRGLCRKKIKDSKGAIEDHSKAIELLPASAHGQIHLDRGLARIQGGDADGAFADFSKAVDLNPGLGWAWNNRAQIREQKGDFKAALLDYDKALAADPENPDFPNNRGSLRSRMGDNEGALEDFDQAILRKPEFAWAFLNRSIALKNLRKFPEALRSADRAATLEPGNPAMHRHRGDVRIALEDFDGALVDLAKAVELDPRFIGAYISRGIAREGKGDKDGALAEFEKAIEIDPLDIDGYHHRSRVFYGAGDFPRAEAEYTRLIKISPKDAKAFERRGRLRYLLGTLDGAVEDLTHSLELAPSAKDTLFTRGSALESLGELDAALADFTRFIEIAPADPWGHHSRAKIRLQKDDLEGALADVNKALELDGNHYYGYEVRCRIRHKQGQLRMALSDADRMVDLKPKESHPLSVRGNLRKRLGDLDGALADFSTALDLDPADSWPQYYRALLHFDARRWAASVKDLRLCHDMGPESGDYIQIRLWLARANLGERTEATAALKTYLEERPAGAYTVQIGAFLAGGLSEAQLFEVARSSKPKDVEGRLLEVRYYSAMKRLQDGDKVKAGEYLKACLASEVRTFFEYDSAVFELEALQPGASAPLLTARCAEETFYEIEAVVQGARSVRLKFHYECRKPGEDKPTILADGSVQVKQGNKVLAVEKITIEGKAVDKKQISDGTTSAFWVRERREDRKAAKTEGAKVLNGILRAGYVQAQLITTEIVPLDPGGDVGNLDPRIFIPLTGFSFGEDDKGARTLLYRFKDDPQIQCKIWYDPKTLRLIQRTIVFAGPDPGRSIETYPEFTLNADLPDEEFKLPPQNK